MKKQMILAIALAMAATLAAAPAQFAYQGVLKDTNGSPLTGTRQVEIRLYDVGSGGSALWGRMYAVQLDANGLFNIEVSDSTGTQLSGVQSGSLEAVFAKTDTIYIGLKMSNSSGEIVPRQKLLPVPFAAVASNVSRASGDFTISGRLTAKSAAFSGALSASTLNVAQSASVGSLATGEATVTGDLTVGGTITGYGTVPVGGIIMWSGAQNKIPTGWYLCNGSHGTPDLRNRFVVGAGGKYAVKATGGEENVTLDLKNIPYHNHSYTYSGAGILGSPNNNNTFYKVGNGGGNTASTLYAGGENGVTVPHNNMPPYYALCFIMRGE